MKIIGYHYIRNFSNKYKNPNGIRFIHINNFCNQLNFFKQNFYLPSVEEFFLFKKGIINLPKDSIILSFDDGLTDHYKYVFSELIERKMWGIFFVPSRPYIENKHIGTFALHHLLGKVHTIELIKNIMLILNNSDLKFEINLNELNKKIINSKNEEDRTLFLKKLINSKNYFKNEELKDILIDKLIQEYIPNFKLYDVYLKPKEIFEMENSGMIIGAHSITHNYMSDLNEIDQFKEIDESFKILNSITGKLKFRLFGYPYGKLNTINNITFKCLEKLNVDAAFLYNESKLGLEYNQKNRTNKYLIPRIRPDYFNFGENYEY